MKPHSLPKLMIVFLSPNPSSIRTIALQQAFEWSYGLEEYGLDNYVGREICVHIKTGGNLH